MIIGIMGKTDSGRSLVTKLLNEENKYEIISVHELYFEVISDKGVKEEIKKKLITTEIIK